MQINDLDSCLIFLTGSMTLRLMGDLLLGLFLAGLLAAFGSFFGMARVAARSAEHRPASASGTPADLLDEYRRACEEDCRAPLLWYAYLASLWIGVGALLLAFL